MWKFKLFDFIIDNIEFAVFGIITLLILLGYGIYRRRGE